ncbi:MAG: M24 family metallopeptidase, partial [Phycisphaerae bacterium]|nr:M24 family metallopeptidase [Phycisphaerae bacterium]
SRDLQVRLSKRKLRGRQVKLQPVENLMVNVRKIKDPIEIAAIRRAVACAQDAYAIVRRDLRIGAIENDIAAQLEYEMRRLGAQRSSFDTNVSAGANSSKPHYRPGRVPVTADSVLLFDWGAVVDGYCSDITRTHFVGRAPPKLREVYRIVLEAQRAAIGAIRPGTLTGNVDRVARNLIAKAGFGKNFGHGLGHGIGLAIHELPRLSRTARPEPLQPGMVVTVEPGIYLPGVGGVRIEDDVLVTESGCEVLTSLDQSFEGCNLE